MSNILAYTYTHLEQEHLLRQETNQNKTDFPEYFFYYIFITFTIPRATFLPPQTLQVKFLAYGNCELVTSQLPQVWLLTHAVCEKI